MIPAFDEYLAFLQRYRLPHYVAPAFFKEESEEGNINFSNLVTQLSRLRPATWFVQGAAGSGKTSLVSHLMLELLEQDVLCARINVATLRSNRTYQGLFELLDALCPLQIDDNLWSSRCKPKHGKILLLVDGINEIEQEFYNTDVWSLILRILEGNHRFPVLATSRHALQDLHQDQRDIHWLSLRPLELAQIQSYLEERGLNADDTLDEIETVKMDGATSNPFLLSLLADFSLANQTSASGKSKWPRSRAELLSVTFGRAIVPHTKEQRYHIARTGLTDKAMLCAAALAFHVLQEDTVRLVELENLLKQVWDSDEERILIKTLVQAFLELHLVDYDENTGYRFTHDSLLDYGLALGAIAQSIDAPPAFAFSSGQFDALLGDWVGAHPEPNTAARQVLEHCQRFNCPEKLIDVAVANRGILDADVLENLWRAIGEGLLTSRYIKTQVADSLGNLPRRLIAEASRYKVLRSLLSVNPWLANRVEYALLDDNFSSKTLIKFHREFNRLNKSDKFHTQGSKTSKATHVKPEDNQLVSLTQFEQLLQEADNESERRKVVMFAARQKLSAAVSLLMNILSTDSYASVQGSAANALGQIGDRSAVAALSEALLDKNARADIRGSAANALGQIGDRSAVAALSEALLDKNARADIRGSAANALGQIGDRSAVTALSEALLDKNARENIRGAAAMALGHIGDRSAVDALSEALKTDNDSFVRGSAATALGKIGDRSAVTALSETLKTDNDSVVRGSAANALGQIGDRSAVAALSEALLDKNARADIRGSAANALGQIGDRSAVTALSEALLDKNARENIRGAAAMALGHIGDRSVVDALSEALKTDNDSFVRGSAATALGKIGDRSAVTALSETLKTENDSVVRGSAANALGHIGDRSAVTALSETLKTDNDSIVRSSAATALGKVGDRSAVTALSEAFKTDDDSKVRYITLFALRAIADVQILPLMRSIADSLDNPKIAELAIETYFHITGKLEPWLFEVDKKTRDKRLRGKITELVAQYATQPEDFTWLRLQACKDLDYIRRTAAVRGLACAQQLDDNVIRTLIDPAIPRRNGLGRDTDTGVCGSVAAAIIEAWVSPHTPLLEHKQLVVNLLANPVNNHRSIINAAFGELDTMPLASAAKVLKEIKQLMPANAHAEFIYQLERHETSLQHRSEQQTAALQLRKNPAEMLRAFQQQAQAKIPVSQPTPEKTMIDCALISVTDTESRTLINELRNRSDVQLADSPETRHGRSYWSFKLQRKNGRPLSCIQIQPSDKGSSSAQALITDLQRDFRPQLMLMVGVCGGFSERGANLYDVIMAFQVHGYERERLIATGNQYQPQSYRFSAEPIGIARSLNTGGLLDEALEGGKFHIKDYAAGEKVIADLDAPLRKRLLEISGDIYGVEMEGHGILHATWENSRHGSLVQTALIKGVSDCCDGDMRIDKDLKQSVAATRAVRVALALIAQLHVVDSTTTS